MNRTVTLVVTIALAMLALGSARAQQGGVDTKTDRSYRVVFDLTSRDSTAQRSVMRWIREITEANPSAQIEVVMYGKGYELMMPERSHYLNDVKAAVQKPNIAFKVCQIALKNNMVDRKSLLDGTQTVPDGIYELISRQRDGWGYIKVVP